MPAYFVEFMAILEYLVKNPCKPEENDSVKAFLHKLLTFGTSEAEKDELLRDLDRVTWLGEDKAIDIV